MQRLLIRSVNWSTLLRTLGVIASSCVVVGATAPGVSWSATSSVTRTIAVDSTPMSLAIDPTTDTMYTANTLKKTISDISLTTGRVTSSIPLDTNPIVVAVDPTTDTVYVDGTHSVVAINGSTDRVTRTIVPSDGAGIAVDPNTDTAYLTSADGLSIVLPPGSRGNSNGSSDRLWFAAGVVVIAVSGGAFMIGMKRRGTVRSA